MHPYPKVTSHKISLTHDIYGFGLMEISTMGLACTQATCALLYGKFSESAKFQLSGTNSYRENKK